MNLDYEVHSCSILWNRDASPDKKNKKKLNPIMKESFWKVD